MVLKTRAYRFIILPSSFLLLPVRIVQRVQKVCYRKLPQTLCHRLRRIIVIVEAGDLFLLGEIILVVRKMRTTKRQASDIKGDISTFLVAIARRGLIGAADAENPARASWLCSRCDQPTVAGPLI
jgi:hypothetical protein